MFHVESYLFVKNDPVFFFREVAKVNGKIPFVDFFY